MCNAKEEMCMGRSYVGKDGVVHDLNYACAKERSNVLTKGVWRC
jgi:hypothetical protein